MSSQFVVLLPDCSARAKARVPLHCHQLCFGGGGERRSYTLQKYVLCNLANLTTSEADPFAAESLSSRVKSGIINSKPRYVVLDHLSRLDQGVVGAASWI